MKDDDPPGTVYIPMPGVTEWAEGMVVRLGRDDNQRNADDWSAGMTGRYAVAEKSTSAR